jgi:ubiquinone/menaquinone biosynthesis C-methylase UbiE
VIKIHNETDSVFHFDIPSDFDKILGRLKSQGIVYPENYLDHLIEKYTKIQIRYPRIVQRIGRPNNRSHFAYSDILKHEGTLLDYGCGTGDDIRALIKDGFPKKNITGYDVDWGNIKIGFDFYLDKEEIKDRFVVSKEFPFEDSSFNIVYSGSNLHVLSKIENVKAYLNHAFAVLKNNGIFFGSTLGKIDVSFRKRRRRVFLMKESELTNALRDAHFSKVKIHPITTDFRTRLWFYAEKL